MATLLSDSSATGRSSHARAENDHEGLGELLRRARERRGLTLEQISNETKIPQRHLEALERDNLAAVPSGFYRRAEVRTYARAVNLDQNLALALLERALEPPRAVEAVRETPRTEERMLSPRRLLIVIGVVVVAAVFGRATGGRQQDLDGDADGHSATNALQHNIPPVRETPRDAVVDLSQRIQLDQAAPPSTRSRGAPAAATEQPAGARTSAALTGGIAVPPAQGEARAPADSVTELVVTTQPAGARVTVDGVGWGSAPVTIRYLPAGNKRIRVSKEGYATEERMVSLAEGHLRMLDIRLRSAP
jgi:cytoskeletal protein RodZ